MSRFRLFLGRHSTALLSVLATALLWLGAWYTVHRQYVDCERNAISQANNLTRAFEQHTLRTIQTLDQFLLYLRASSTRDGQSFDLKAWVREYHIDPEFTFQVSIIDQNGMLAATTLNMNPSGVDLSDKETFRVHAENDTDNLHISKPLLGTLSRRWSIQFSRRINGAGNTFAGVVLVSVDPMYLSRFYDAIDLGKDGAVIVLGHDGIVRTRAAQTGDMLGRSYAGTEFFNTIRGSRVGVITDTSPEDATTRIYAHRGVAGYPLIVLVGIGRTEAFSAYFEQRDTTYPVTIVLSAFLLTFGSMIRRHHDSLERTQCELQARTAHYLGVVNGVNDVIFKVNSRGECVFLNTAWTRLTGFDVESALGRPLLDFVDAEDRNEDPQLFCTSGKSADSFSKLVQFVTKFGELRWIDVRARPEFNQRGVVEGLYGTLTDVTDRLAADMARYESDTRARAIFESAAEGIFSINETGRIERVNCALLQMFKKQESDLIGQPITALGPAEDIESYVQQRVRDGGPPLHSARGWEILCRRVNGKEFPVELTLSEMQLPSGRHFTCIIRDVTERKKIEKIKDDFVSTVSHELRTPMAAIVGSLGLIKSGAIGAIPAQVLTLIDMAHRNCDRLVRLLNDILDMERISSGQIDLKLTDLDLNGIALEAISLNRPHADEKKVTFEISTLEIPAVVRADADRIMQVMTNLISNALKYSSPGGAINIMISVEGTRYRISVQDHGPGIPDEFRAQIFTRFARADSSDNRAKGGTGLGLFICKLIIDHHGGIIGFDSIEGHGSTFFFELDMGRLQSAPSQAA